MPGGRHTIDITGQRFGRLKVIEFSHRDRYTHWKCICDCGKITIKLGHNLKNGTSASCGCLVVDTLFKRCATHKLTGTSTYITWNAMLKRCNLKTYHAYSSYGGRGIKVCKRWHKFENFFKDMGERPSETTLDRIDNNKGYYKENCRWATKREQANNKSTTIFFTYKGETKPIAEWARQLDLPLNRIASRVRLGWTVGEEVFSKELFKSGPRLTKEIK